MEYDWHSVVCCCYFYSRYPAAMQGNAEESQQDSYRPHWSDSVFACTFRSRHNGADADVDLTCQASSGCKNSKIIRHHKRGCRTSKYFLLGGSPALCPNGGEIGCDFALIPYKRSSFPDIPFGMPDFKLFCFQPLKSMLSLMKKDDSPFFRSESCNEAY